jgi:hypothetical protein
MKQFRMHMWEVGEAASRRNAEEAEEDQKEREK